VSGIIGRGPNGEPWALGDIIMNDLQEHERAGTLPLLMEKMRIMAEYAVDEVLIDDDMINPSLVDFPSPVIHLGPNGDAS
jgi:hypothetical protein